VPAVEVSCPIGKGRARVRAIIASSFCSTRQLMTAAAPATSAMPIVAPSMRSSGGPARHREEHPDHGREDDERDDARFGELVELAQHVRAAGYRLLAHRRVAAVFTR
jgi:hypothetical protein